MEGRHEPWRDDADDDLTEALERALEKATWEDSAEALAYEEAER
jgi:hypothetical protein